MNVLVCCLAAKPPVIIEGVMQEMQVIDGMFYRVFVPGQKKAQLIPMAYVFYHNHLKELQEAIEELKKLRKALLLAEWAIYQKANKWRV